MKRQATAELKAINKELKVKERELKENVNRMEALETVLHRLDKATPKQLRDTIKEIKFEIVQYKCTKWRF